METTYGLIYSVARAREVTAWQSVDAVSLCCLTHCSCVEVTGLHSLLLRKWWQECCHLSIPFPPAACVGPTCVQHACIIIEPGLTHSLYTCVYFFVIFCGLVQSQSDDMQSYAFKCSMFCTHTRSGSPHDVMHSSSREWSIKRVLSVSEVTVAEESWWYCTVGTSLVCWTHMSVLRSSPVS